MLNKSKGNMYEFCTHTWNAIKGKCSHDCSYCYMKVFPQGELRLDEKEFKTDLGKGNTIFVGSSTDMFADNVPCEWIFKVLNYCCKFQSNIYIFQTKNPIRFFEFDGYFPDASEFGTTIETNKQMLLNKISKAPTVQDRQDYLCDINGKTFVTIEPILNFDLDVLVAWIKDIDPDFVNIGADSKNHNLPEPNKEKIEALIEELKKFTKVNIKDNLRRLMK